MEKKIQEDKREGWGSDGELFDLDWWYLISTVITIPMAMAFPFLCPCYILGTSGGSTNACRKESSDIPRSTSNWNIQNNESEKTGGCTEGSGCVFEGRGVIVSPLCISEYINSASRRRLDFGWPLDTRGLCSPAAIPSAPIINHCLVTEQGVCKCVLLKSAEHRSPYFPALNVCTVRKVRFGGRH